MNYDEELITHKLRKWDQYLQNYKLPQWEEIPDLGLYMEQITTLLTQYLNYLPQELKDEQFITAATINNYVRKKVMPGPVKKRYYRMHIAYLIIICSLKQSMSITALQNLLPKEPTEEGIREVYENYVKRYQQACDLFLQWTRKLAGPMLGHENTEDGAQTPDDLIITTAVASGYARLMSEKLLMLDGETLESITAKKEEKQPAARKASKAEKEEKQSAARKASKAEKEEKQSAARKASKTEKTEAKKK